MIGRVLVLSAVVIGLHTAPALAADRNPRLIQAQKDCLSGKTDSGVALLAELYAEAHNPNYIYNQARCYEQAARPEDALNRFREYLRVAKKLTEAERADVEKHMEECRALAAEQERAREKKAAPEVVPLAPPEVSAPNPTPHPETPIPEAQLAPGLDLTAQPQAAESSPIYKKWWFWTGIAAVVGGGVTAYFLATHRKSENFCSGVDIQCVATPN